MPNLPFSSEITISAVCSGQNAKIKGGTLESFHKMTCRPQQHQPRHLNVVVSIEALLQRSTAISANLWPWVLVACPVEKTVDIAANVTIFQHDKAVGVC